MYKPAWKQEYIISGDYSLLRLLSLEIICRIRRYA